jgi:hypothetical protein
VWATASLLRRWLRALDRHRDYFRHRKVLDFVLAQLSPTLASTGVLAPKKRRQLTDARVNAAAAKRRQGLETEIKVRAKAAELKAQRKKLGEKPLPYSRLCGLIAKKLVLSLKQVERHYPKSFHT